MVDAYRQDAKYAARALLRSPLFTLIAVLSVAIGVGATTGIVTLADALLLRSSPGIGAPERAVLLGRTDNGFGFDNFSYLNFVDYKTATKSLSGLASLRMEPMPVSLAGPDGGEPFSAGVVGGSFFDVLQARPAFGRFFLPEEDRVPGANPVVVLSYNFWSSRFASDKEIVGRSITLNNQAFTVVGVAAEEFHGPIILAPDMWVPVMASGLIGWAPSFTERRGASMIAVGRLAPDATYSSAQAEAKAISQRLETQFPVENRGRGFKIAPVSPLPGDARLLVGGFMGLLLAIAGLVLVVASTNVAGMLLARATSRRREIAVRLALGASRAQLVRQLVIESLMLFTLAGAGGIVLANWLVGGLVALFPKLPFPVAFDPSIDWRMLTFALVVSLATGLLTGVVPALQATRPELVPALKAGGGGGSDRQTLRGRLLVAQIAFSMLLLVVAGLFGRALVRAKEIDPGFDPQRLHIATTDLRLANYDAARGLPAMTEIVRRVEQLPGVQAAAFTAMLPLDGGGMGLGEVRVDGLETPPERGWREDWNAVSPGYFETMRIPLLRGRDFNESDRTGGSGVAILNQAFAEALFPGRDPLGRTIHNGDRTMTVIGVARDSKYRALNESRRNFIYVPVSQYYVTRTVLVIRMTNDQSPAALVRRIVAEVDKSLPIIDQRSFEAHAVTMLLPQRLAVYVAGSMGSVALLLALLGIYGVTAFSVAQRTREIGVRVALGADRSRVVGHVLGQGFRVAGIGVGIGAALAFAVTRLIDSLLFGVPATDIIAFVGAGLALSVAALVASWVPAMRAAAVDPVVALRSE